MAAPTSSILKSSLPPAPLERTIRIAVDADVYGLRQAVRVFSAGLGFARIPQGELVIAASELASNILKYAGQGEITLRRVVDPTGRIGIEIAAHDQGPPILDFAAALRDGWSEGGPIDPMALLRRRGIGAGLGAVARFSDRLYYEPNDRSGKSIVAQRFIYRRSSLLPKARRYGG